jgi:hypothetical protein
MKIGTSRLARQRVAADRDRRLPVWSGLSRAFFASDGQHWSVAARCDQKARSELPFLAG